MAWLAHVLLLLHICSAEASTDPGFNRSFVTNCGEEPRTNGLRHIFSISFLQRCSVTMFVYTAPRRNPASGLISVSHRAGLRTPRRLCPVPPRNGAVPRFHRQQLRPFEVWPDTQLREGSPQRRGRQTPGARRVWRFRSRRTSVKCNIINQP